MVIYSDTDLSETIVAGGRATSGCNGKIYVFIRQDGAPGTACADGIPAACERRGPQGLAEAEPTAETRP